ncbi:hypothetical protein [Aurantiacibacter aquimixticola]|uniref:Uncharacterized protein n=1 Tax=Aurantiacibacter aquimixticola TaxID=1958945 RepID=A0A419RVC1_9SPHN|nr:hypothetical protein [Aurantiacibacter aquimixticola]RJY09736.1 hypothetical protein D6201_10585 [Aurantiacibacter aquimixticola]
MTGRTHDKRFLLLPKGQFWRDEEAAEQIDAAIRAGGLWAGGPVAILLIPLGLIGLLVGDGAMFVISFVPLFIAFIGTVILMFTIMLPATVLLTACKVESRGVYECIGLVGGLIIPPVFCQLIALPPGFSIFFAFFGGVAGLSAGSSWGTWRCDNRVERICPYREYRDRRPPRTPNEIHELLH